MDEINYNTPEYDADDSDIEEEDRDESLEDSLIRRETALEIFRKLAEKIGEWKFGTLEITLNAIEDLDFYQVAFTYGIAESDLTLTKENEG
jgi:hypothetical protein